MTEIGAIGHEPVIRVGADGTLGDIDGSLRFDWWVGAEDRWHRASVEHAVRQELGEDEVTIETRLRVPGGDVVCRVTSVPHHANAVALVEIRNDTPVPVALALIIDRPGAFEVVDDICRVDGHAVLRASRSIARSLVADDHAGLLAGLEAGAALPPAERAEPARGRHVALVVPVPHTASVRAVVAPIGDHHLGGPDDLPPIDAVARGWELHVGNGAQVSIPDERLTLAAAAARRHLLVGAGLWPRSTYWRGTPDWAPPVAAVALDSWGHHTEARELLLMATGHDDLTTHAVRSPVEAGSVLWAWAEILERRPDAELSAALSGWLTEAAIGLLRRRRGFFRRGDVADPDWRAVGLASASSLLSRVEDGPLGPDLGDAMPDLIGDLSPHPGSLALALAGRRLGLPEPPLSSLLAELVDAPEPSLSAIAGTSTPSGALGTSGRAHDPAASAILLLALRRAMVDELDGTGGPVALLAAPDPVWLGGLIEAHGMPITGGSAGFGVRWHGERPALLWDVQAAAAVEVRAPALDPGWSDERAKADVLLAPTPDVRLEDAPRSPGEAADEPQGDRIDPGEEPPSFA